MTSPVRAPRPTPRRAPQPTPARDRRAHLRVVPPPATRRRPSKRHTPAIVVVATALIFGSLLASAVFHGLLASGQTRLDHLDTELQQERESLAQERLELANLRSPERIAAEATALGMVPADTQHWVSAGSGDETVVVRDPADATAAADDGTGTGTTDATDATDTTDTTETNDELATSDGGGTPQ